MDVSVLCRHRRGCISRGHPALYYGVPGQVAPWRAPRSHLHRLKTMRLPELFSKKQAAGIKVSYKQNETLE